MALEIARALGCSENDAEKILPILRRAMSRPMWLTIPDFARKHGVSPAQVRRRCDRKGFPPGTVEDWGMGGQHYYMIRADALDHEVPDSPVTPPAPHAAPSSRRRPPRLAKYQPQILTDYATN